VAVEGRSYKTFATILLWKLAACGASYTLESGTLFTGHHIGFSLQSERSLSGQNVTLIRMNTTEILSFLDAEIATLQEAHPSLSEKQSRGRRDAR